MHCSGTTKTTAQATKIAIIARRTWSQAALPERAGDEPAEQEHEHRRERKPDVLAHAQVPERRR
jgi:hypothetical protein